MSVSRFYRLAVWLPLLIPAVVTAGVSLFGMPRGDRFDGVVGMLWLTMWHGGIPYLLLALWASFRIGNAPEQAIRRLACFMPLYMLPIYLIYQTGVAAVRGESLVLEMSIMLIGLAWILFLGYAYVALVFGMRALGIRLRWLSGDAAAAA